MSPIELVRAKEEEIKFNRFESAFAVDEAGNVLMDKAGEQFHVGFTLEERERLRAGRGVIFTHNHPRGWGYPESSPLRGGSSFSDTDVRFACQTELAETRVVTPRHRYFMRPPAQGWSLGYWDALLEPSYTHHEADVHRYFRLLLARKQIAAEKAGTGTAHEIWTRVAAEWGLIYGREQEG